MFNSCFKFSKPRMFIKVISLFLAFLFLFVSPQATLALELLSTLKSNPVEEGRLRLKQIINLKTINKYVYSLSTVNKSVYDPATVNQSVYAPGTVNNSVDGQKPPALKKPPVKGPPQLNPKDPAVIKTMQLARSVRKRMAYRASRGGRYSRINYTKSLNIDMRKYRTVRVKATAYSPKDKGVGKYTFSEVRVQRHLVAVDPRVIPLGSVIYVPGYGLAVAADIGSGVRGYHIDVYMESRKKALTWGKKYIDVYIYSG